MLNEIWAVDFDGTLVKEYPGKFIINVNKFEETEYGSVQTCIDAQKFGVKIILWTCRDGPALTPAVEYLLKRGFTPNAINKNIIKFAPIMSAKVFANRYFDNRSFPEFTSWRNVRETLLADYYKDHLFLPPVTR